jgi:amino acid transporter
LAENKIFVVLIILAIFWGATFFNFLGIEIASKLSALSVVIGTLIPGALIIGLGCWWLLSAHPSAINFSVSALIPDFNLSNVVIFSGVILALAGVELAAFHIVEADRPQRNYPLALGCASVIILLIYILGTVGIAIVVPQQEISLAAGILQAFQVFFTKLNIVALVPFMALCLFLGSIAGINAWTVGPAKGMLVVANDGFFPAWLQRVNSKGVPTALLILQAIIGSILTTVFFYMENNAGIWILTALSAQFTVMQYLLVFLAALKLRFSQPKVARGFRAPFMPLLVLIGSIACIFSFFIVYIEPAQLSVGNGNLYRAFLLISLGILSLPPYLLLRHRRRSGLVG